LIPWLESAQLPGPLSVIGRFRMSAILELCMFPLGEGESVSPYVARSINIIKESGLPYVFGPMSTSVEGEWDELLALATKCYEAMRADCHRIQAFMRLDCREGAKNRLTGKIRSVESKL